MQLIVAIQALFKRHMRYKDAKTARQRKHRRRYKLTRAEYGHLIALLAECTDTSRELETKFRHKLQNPNNP